MNNKRIIAGVATAMAILAAGPTRAEVFGGAEFGYAVDTNFNGASTAAAQLKEVIHSYTAYLGNYTPSADRRSAFILRGDVQANRLQETSALDNNLFGVSVGGYQSFGPVASMTATLSARAKRFDDDRRNGEVYGVALGFKQKVTNNFWFREGLMAEYGAAQVSTGTYNGYGVNVSLNWRAPSATLLSLGGGWNRRIYDVLAADERTNVQATLGVVQEIGKHVYVRLSATHQVNSASDGSEYSGNVYSAGFGVNL